MLFYSFQTCICIQETGKYYTPTAGSSVLQQCGLIGEGVKRPTFEDYRMFVQSTGSGARHLPINSTILYEQVSRMAHIII